MKIEKSDINVFLALWIKNDRELWSELRDIQIRLLVERIVKEMSFKDMAKQHGVPTETIKKLFEAILVKIDYCISSEVAKHLSIINEQLEDRGDKPFEVIEIYLN